MRLSEVEELVPADTSKLERALEAIARREALAEHGETDDPDELDDEADDDAAPKAARGTGSAPGADAGPAAEPDAAAAANPGVETAVEAAPTILSKSVTGSVADDLLAKGIAEVRAKLN